MKKFSLIVAIALTLMALPTASSNTRNIGGVPPQSEAQAKKPKGKLLVKKLPAGVQGVTVSSGVVKLKPGYKFVKQDDGTIAVARIKRGGGGVSAVGGSWRCDCKPTDTVPNPDGSCTAEVITTIRCNGETSCTSGGCTLVVIIEGVTTSVMSF